MNITKLELPDGRLVTIEGGDAESTAQFIANHYLGLTPKTTGNVRPLMLPSVEQPSAPATAPTLNVPVLTSKIEPLVPPVWNFDKQETAPATTMNSGGIQPLVAPKMEFKAAPRRRSKV